jgi:hypothetical protein
MAPVSEVCGEGVGGGWQTCRENQPSLHGPLVAGGSRVKGGTCGVARPRAGRSLMGWAAAPTYSILARLLLPSRGESGGGLSSSLVPAATNARDPAAGPGLTRLAGGRA